MYFPKRIAGLAFAGMLAACSTSPTVPSRTSSGYQFGYELENGRAAGVIQAFDDGKFTYLQAGRSASDVTVRLAWNGPPLPADRQGPYLLIKGVYESLYIEAKGERAVARNSAAVIEREAREKRMAKAAASRPAATLAPAAHKAEGNDSPDTLREELAKLSAELTLLRASLLADKAAAVAPAPAADGFSRAKVQADGPGASKVGSDPGSLQSATAEAAPQKSVAVSTTAAARKAEPSSASSQASDREASPHAASEPPPRIEAITLSRGMAYRSHDFTVARDDSAIRLVFKTLPSQLFVSDIKTSAPIRNAVWTSESSLRIDTGRSSGLRIDTGNVVVAIAFDSASLNQKEPSKKIAQRGRKK